VGNVDDAEVLRETGVALPLLLYPNCLPDAAEAVLRRGLAITLNGRDEAEAWSRALRRPVDCWIKLDMGAFRAGVLPQGALDLARFVAAQSCFALKGMYGHLHLPDPIAMADHARWQFANFERALREVEGAGIPVPLRMVAGTAAVLQYPEMDLNAVDPGRLLYGLGFAGARRDFGLRPAFKALKARLVMRKDLAQAEAGGYAPPFALRRDMAIGLLPLGWGDGYPRPVPKDAVALVRGKRAPLLGPTHFEHLRIDLSDVPEAAYGDEVVLVGRQGTDELTAEAVARSWGMSPLELYGGLRGHIERRYVQ
jgi:alanine racemase